MTCLSVRPSGPSGQRRPVRMVVTVPATLLLAVVAFSAAAQDAALPAAQERTLETSDGVRFTAWYYATPSDVTPAGTVILIHDVVEGSQKTLVNLATSLQRSGYAVVAPDLRGRGAGSHLSGEGGEPRGDPADSVRGLKKSDFEAMAASRGRVRDDPASSHRGEIEAVRAWIKQQADAGKIDIDRLCVVGSGLGATLAAMWAAADWNWPPTTSGPQGQQVRALVLVSPAMSKRGLSMTGPLASESIRFAIPVLVIAGSGDRESARFFDQFKRFRPKEWVHHRGGQQPQVDTAKELKTLEEDKAMAAATAFFIQCSTSLSGNGLATDATVGVPEMVKTFLSLVLARKRD